MGVSIEVWRARIGSFNGNSSNLAIFCMPVTLLLTGLHLFMIIFVLLLIGNVELNPGPDNFNCALCGFKAKTAEEHVHHQNVHAGLFNFKFVCPFPLCHHSYSTFKSVSAHLSQHSTPRHQLLGEADNFTCDYCEKNVSTRRDYCKHLKKHLEVGLEVHCPLMPCDKAFTSSSAFSVHLSRYHPGWLKDFNSPALQTSSGAGCVDPHHQIITEPPLECVHEDEFYDAMDYADDGSDTTSTSSMELNDDGHWYHDQIITYIAHFYAMLEGKFLVPYSTVDALAAKLSFISEVLQNKLRADLKKILSTAGLPETDITRIIQGVLSSDPLYNSHHNNAAGDCLLTFDRRQTFYKKNFKYIEPVEINLKKNPRDREDTVQYVNVKKNLEVMLEDPSVQKEIDQSFSTRASDGSILKNYTDGSVFRNSSTPAKSIDLILFMDAFNCCNPLGSAKKKFKMHGMYMTLGNLKPYLRSFLKSIRLVLLLNDNSLKGSQRQFKRCFKTVMKDLKDLEDNGLDYKGEKIAVRVQFLVGDNLGQHTLGGFIECFTGTHFCRYCDISAADFKASVTRDKPQVRFGVPRTPDSFNNDLHQFATGEGTNDHHRGVKRDSPLHVLNHFHVCDPRLAPCPAHDLFIGGVVDSDCTAMINAMVNKGWFTVEFLNMRLKRFKYFGNDGRNKPAPFSVKKLGGHSAQNWTLFRLLPLLIGDKVKTDDKLWKLYLLLKSAVEMACAPALSAQQIESMRGLIKKYMRKRRILGTKYKPKHHFFAHYPDLFLQFGPLIHLWTLAFEHRHQYFKKVAKISNNFINLGKLLASKFQLLQAYMSMGELFPDSASYSKCSPLDEGDYEPELQDFLSGLNLSKDAVEVKGLKVNEVTYQKNNWLLLHSEGDAVVVGQVKVMVDDGDKCRLIVKRYRALKWDEYGLYYLSDELPEFSVLSLENLENPCPHPVYDFHGQLCFSLKHVFQA